jgi:hypothetical protein
VITRNPTKAQDIADEVVYGDLDRPETLNTALEGAYGVFLVTDYWSKTTIEDWADPVDEFTQGKAAVEAARRAGVTHFVWSTLPDTMQISSGAFDLPFWTGKAKLDDVVSEAGFDYVSFVEAPFYYQNFLDQLAPELQEDGTKAWNLPIRPESKVNHMGDIDQIGSIVLGSFLHPTEVGQGQHMSLCGGLYSWSDIVDTFNAAGHRVEFNQVPAQNFDDLFPGAKNLRDSFDYLEGYTYFGPDSDQKIALANAVATEAPAAFEEWVRNHLPS